jgi:hypothetical protein
MSKKQSLRRNIGRRIIGTTMPITRRRARWGRNWPCLCGSGKKYKQCCLSELDAITASDGNANVQPLSEDVHNLIKSHQEAQKTIQVKVLKDGGKKDG